MTHSIDDLKVGMLVKFRYTGMNEDDSLTSNGRVVGVSNTFVNIASDPLRVWALRKDNVEVLRIYETSV